ncbi:MAG TPA: ABC transporter substrate-binding protein [Steroidobacter sp.]|uniref:ABC transporter substrate-binding protein n=1 Tax=Steroidobacter sp. TaxID=1978227 RepID=UPI002EDA1DC7
MRTAIRTAFLPVVFIALTLTSCAHVPQSRDNEDVLRVVGRPDVMEIGPIIYATQVLLPEQTQLRPGGVANLFKRDTRVERSTDQPDPFPGAADVAGHAETQALRISVENPDLRIIMTVTEGIYRIVGRRSAGIAALADLAGKRIGVVENTSSAYFLHRMLGSIELSETDVVIVPLRTHEMTSAIVAGEVDAIAIWEPISERACAALGADAIEFQNPRTYRELYNLNTTVQALADPHKRAQIVRLVRALIDAARQSETAPEKIWPLVAARSGLPLELVAASWPHHRFPAALPDDLLDVLVAEETWLAAKAGRSARPREVLAQLIDASVLAEAREESLADPSAGNARQF